MTEEEKIQNIEKCSRDIRLSEQAVFRSVLANKNRKHKRGFMFLIGGFTFFGLLWVLLHCVPLMR